MNGTPSIPALYETWRAAQARWLAIEPDKAAGHPDVEPAGAALMAAEEAIDAAPAATAGDVLWKLAATAQRAADCDTPDFVAAVIREAVGIVDRQRAAHAAVAGEGGGRPVAFLFGEAEREHWRLEAALRTVEQRPLFSDADRAEADEEGQRLVDRQLAIEASIYRVPAETLAEAVIKARFLRRNADADLPDDLTTVDAYSYRPQCGGRLPCGVASLWADLERLALPAPRIIGARDRRLLALRDEWEAARLVTNHSDRLEAEKEAACSRMIDLEQEAFRTPADGLAGLAVKAHIAMHNATGGKHDVAPEVAYAGEHDGLDQHATLSLWADIARLAAGMGAP